MNIYFNFLHKNTHFKPLQAFPKDKIGKISPKSQNNQNQSEGFS